MNSPGGNTRRNMGELSLACLAHLEQEEALLVETLESLREVRAALLGGDLAALCAAIERQSHGAHRTDELRSRRARLRSDLAAALGVAAAAVTMQLLPARLPPEEGSRLAGCCERLRCMAAEIDQLNRANAALLRHSLDFLHQFLVEITGGPSHGACYTAAGTLREAACGSIIEARG